MASSCSACPAGAYCQRDINSGTDILLTTNANCPAGSYCEENTAYPTPCPAGKYRLDPRGASEDDCSSCEEGKYCDLFGDDQYQPKECDDGYHCITGSKSPRPGCLDKQEGTGEICPLGSYCEGGFATPCPPGKVCDKYGEKTIADLVDCPEGYYCLEGTLSETVPGFLDDSIEPKYPIFCGLETSEGGDQRWWQQRPNWRDDHVGTGVYCPEGSGAPQSCPTGTWSMSLGSGSVEDYFSPGQHCSPCPEGMACTREGIYNVTIDGTQATKGYYISSQGASNSKPDDLTFGGKCTVNNFCPEGSKSQIPCEPGTFNSKEGKDSCSTCTSGKYCPGGIGITGGDSSIATECTEGHYCPAGVYQPIPCPVGKYGRDGITTYKSESNCQRCDPGKYCDEEGLVESDIQDQN